MFAENESHVKAVTDRMTSNPMLFSLKFVMLELFHSFFVCNTCNIFPCWQLRVLRNYLEVSDTDAVRGELCSNFHFNSTCLLIIVAMPI